MCVCYITGFIVEYKQNNKKKPQNKNFSHYESSSKSVMVHNLILPNIAFLNKDFCNISFISLKLNS